MSNELEKKDTQAAKLAGVLRRLIPAAESADCVCEHEGIGPEHLSGLIVEAANALAAYDADAPVLTPSETEEEEASVPTKYLAKSVQVLTNDCMCAARMVQAAIKVSDFPSGLAELISKLSHLYGTLDEFQKQHAQAVEAAYREGWEKKHDFFSATSDWVRSEAKKKLEGMK